MDRGIGNHQGKAKDAGMKTYRELFDSLKEDDMLRELTAEERRRLQRELLNAFVDLNDCCERHHLTLMLIGGSALGAVRHHGFIPWDDDLDVAMPREDFNRLKKVFDTELGDKYILSAPNFKNEAKSRFPVMLVKGTRMVDVTDRIDDELSKIKIDIFLIDNIPGNKIIQTLKGVWCTGLMAAASYVYSLEHRNERIEAFMSKTDEGKRAYGRRLMFGKLLSFKNTQQWYDAVDKAFQYKKKTGLMGIPSGRGHYFGEIRPRSTFLPVSKGTFEGHIVNLPGNPDDYLSNLFGANYMELPPIEKREKHFIVDIQFRDS